MNDSNDKKTSIEVKRLLFIALGTAISSFGIYNIHRQTNITEGGVLGLILLLNNWTGLSPALLTPLLDILCYAFAFRYLGKDFIKVSFLSTLSLAGFFKLWEMFPPILPNLSAYPLVAAIAGGLFVGSGVGLIIGQGASSGGDDALCPNPLKTSPLPNFPCLSGYRFYGIAYIPVLYSSWPNCLFPGNRDGLILAD